VAAPTPAAETSFRPSASIVSIYDLPTATIGMDTSIRLITLHEDGSETYEFIDADVNVKRRTPPLPLEEQGRRVRFRTDAYRPEETPTPSPPIDILSDTPVPRFVSIPRTPNPTPAMAAPSAGTPLAGTPLARTPAASPEPPDVLMHEATAAKEKRSRLASELRESISIADIGEKIMNMPVQLFPRDHPQAQNLSTWSNTSRSCYRELSQFNITQTSLCVSMR
jgi:hypothetical protein